MLFLPRTDILKKTESWCSWHRRGQGRGGQSPDRQDLALKHIPFNYQLGSGFISACSDASWSSCTPLSGAGPFPEHLEFKEGWSHGSSPVDTGFRDIWVPVSPEVVAELLKSILRSELGAGLVMPWSLAGMDKRECRYFLERRFPSQIRTG